MLGNLDGDIVGGPFSLDEVRRDLETGRLQGHELLAKVGTKNWRPIEKAFARARDIESGAVPSLPPGAHPSAMPPGAHPSAMPPGAHPSAMPPGAHPSAMPPAMQSAPMIAAPPIAQSMAAMPMASVFASAPMAPPSNERWYLARTGTPTIGPLPTEQIL